MGLTVTIIPGVGDVLERGINGASVEIVDRMQRELDDRTSVAVISLYDENMPRARDTMMDWLRQNGHTEAQALRVITDMQSEFNSSHITIENEVS